MNKSTSLRVRVKHSSSAAGYIATTLVPRKGRATASATSCARQALTRAAAKGLGVMDDQVLLFELGADKPVLWECHVGNEWETFEARVKGSTTQLDLSLGGAS